MQATPATSQPAPKRRTLTVDLSDYQPTPTQARFLRSRERIVLAAAGYGGGKTRAGSEKFLRVVLSNPGCTLQMIAPTYQMLHRLSLRAFMEACPAPLIVSHHKSERRIEMVNGATVYYGSADSPGSLEGVNLAGFWVDEGRLISSEAWRVIVGRLRDKRARMLQGMVTTTPAMGWLSDEFGGDRPDRASFHWSTVENAANLAPGFIDNLRRTYSPRLAKSLIDGEFSVVAGQVYEEFDESVHLIDWSFDPSLPVWLFWDFGANHPSVLFAQVTGDFGHVMPDGRELPPRSVVVFDELHTDQTPTDRTVPKVQARLASYRARPWRIACDPAGNARDQGTGIRSVELLTAAFGPVVRWETDARERSIANGIARVQGALQPVEGAPSLYVSRTLKTGAARGVVRAFQGYRYPETKDGRPASDLPLKDGITDHAMDALRYGVIAVQNERIRGNVSGERIAAQWGR